MIPVPNSNCKADFFYPTPGVTLLNDQLRCWRPLENRQRSTVWLVEDETPENFEHRFCRAEIFTRSATHGYQTGLVNELSVRKAIEAKRVIRPIPTLAFMLDEGELDGPAGAHYFIIFSDVDQNIASACLLSPTHTLKPYIAKLIIRNTLSALDILDDLGIVHTEVNSSNIVRRAGGVEGTVADLVAYPAERVGEVVINGQVHSEYSPRPIPCGTNPLWKASQLFAELENYYLEVVSVEPVGRMVPFERFSHPGLVAPEAIIGCKLTSKYDFWGVACLAFKLLLGDELFKPCAAEGAWGVEDDLLAQIFELTGERFSKETLKEAQMKDRFIDGEGNLLKTSRKICPTSFEDRISSYAVLNEKEASLLASFLRKCLRVNPADRDGFAISDDLWPYGWVHE